MSIKIKRKKISIILILALIVGTMVGCGQSDTKKEGPVQIKMEKYIKDAYKEDFVVEVPIMHRDEGGISNYDNAVAYPKKDKSLKFEIDYRGGKFSDNYMDVKWAKEGKTILESKLKEVYGENISCYYGFSSLIDNNTRKMSYSEVISKYNYKSNIEIAYYVFLGDKLDKMKEAGNIYEIFKSAILDKKVSNYTVSVFFFDNKYKNSFVIKNGDDGALDDKSLYNEKKLLNVVYFGDWRSTPTENVNDVIKDFKY